MTLTVDVASKLLFRGADKDDGQQNWFFKKLTKYYSKTFMKTRVNETKTQSL